MSKVILKTVTDTTLDSPEHLHVVPMGFRLTPSNVTLDDYERSQMMMVGMWEYMPVWITGVLVLFIYYHPLYSVCCYLSSITTLTNSWFIHIIGKVQCGRLENNSIRQLHQPPVTICLLYTSDAADE